MSRKSSTRRGRKSVDLTLQPLKIHAPPVPDSQNAPKKEGKSSITQVEVTALYEAFDDFWNDAVLNPVPAAGLPDCVVRRLRRAVDVPNTAPDASATQTTVEFVIVEQTYTRPSPGRRNPCPSFHLGNKARIIRALAPAVEVAVGPEGMS